VLLTGLSFGNFLKPDRVAAGAARVFVKGTSHHRIVVIDKTSNRWREVVVEGLEMLTCEGQSCEV
jgi:hypothetical protein